MEWRGRQVKSTQGGRGSAIYNLHLLRSLSLGGLAVLAVQDRSDSDDSLVDGSLNAVVLLDVQLGHGVVLEGRGLLDVSEGRGVNDVSVRK